MAARKTLRRIVVAGLATVGIAVGLPATAAHADPLCNVSQNTWVRSGPSTAYPVIYTIPAGGGFRLDVYSEFWDWELGHGNGQVSGWIPNDGRIVNCH